MTTFLILASFAIGLYLGLTLKDKEFQPPKFRKGNIKVFDKKVVKTLEEETKEALDKNILATSEGEPFEL